jgi:pimeloyl-ACP methyl ester carboxylesterase
MEFARTVRWNWEGTEILLGVEEAGSGPSVVLLPALSSISTRAEMRPLFDRLVSEFRAVTVDWPGFGDVVRPQADTTPDSLSAFLNWFLSDVLSPPHMAVAAGHAATYALYQAVHWPGTINRLVLLAPTWRGPLPTMIGSRRPWFARVQSAVDHQSIGPLLYRLNVSSFVIKKMAREHVYSDPDWLAGDRLEAKLGVTRAPGARHASVRFVTGGLDRVVSREAFLDLARRVKVPILVVYGDETPAKSKAEMEALAALPNVRVEHLTSGKLAIHEEFPEAISRAVKAFDAPPGAPGAVARGDPV